MIYPILAYGDPVLRKKTKELTKEYPKLDKVLENMFETMYEAHGIGLAAPQVGLALRLFIVDASPFEDDEDLSEEEQEFCATFKRVFINAQVVEETGDELRKTARAFGGVAAETTGIGAELQASLRALREAADSVNDLADTLKRDPGSLLHGRQPAAESTERAVGKTQSRRARGDGL